MKRANNFNMLADVYDALVFLVFGNAVRKAQIQFLYKIADRSCVLIVGGGTGWILEELDKLKIKLNVTYIDASRVMIDKSKKRGPFQYINVNFLTKDSINDHDQFDVVLTNFFLDVFNPENLRRVMLNINDHLKLQGQWFCTDFVEGRVWWQKVMIVLMFKFFKLTTNLEGDHLLDFNFYFNELGYKVLEERNFYKRMIKTQVLQKF